MYVPKEVTESSSGKDFDNTPHGDDIDVIIENVKKNPQHRSSRNVEVSKGWCGSRTSLLKNQILILSLMLGLFSNPRH